MDSTDPLANAFAEHLRARSTPTAIALRDALADRGLDRRSEYLASFLEQGPHDTSADWWSRGTPCHIGLIPPPIGEMQSGNLWFDPLDVTWSLAVPYHDAHPELPPAMPPFLCWFALDRVTDWQLLGAHQIAPDVPPTIRLVGALSAWRYCALFGKHLTDFSTWSMLREAFGLEMVRRLWGDSPGEIGLGGPEENDAHLMLPPDIVHEPELDELDLEMTGDDMPTGLCFRAEVDLQGGLITDHNALERTWQW